MSLANDYFLLYHGITFEENLDLEPIETAVNETAKYSVKSDDYLTDDEERNLQIVKDLEEGLFRKRLISYGGLMKEIHKELNLDDAEDGDLVKVNDEDDDEKEDEGFTVTAMWNWKRQNYYIKNVPIFSGHFYL